MSVDETADPVHYEPEATPGVALCGVSLRSPGTLQAGPAYTGDWGRVTCETCETTQAQVPLFGDA